MKTIRLSTLITKNLFSLGFIVLFFYAGLLVLSAYDLEDKLLISFLELEADKVKTSSSIEAYNKISSSQFTLYSVNDLPEWAQGEFDNELRPIRELTNSQKAPVHGKIFTMNNTSRVVLIFETQNVIQATRHIFNIIEFLVSGFLILLILGSFYSYKASKKIALPIKKFAEFVRHNSDLKVYESTQKELSIAELHHLVEGYNASIKHQLSAIQREKQLNQDISHELRTPLTVLQGALEVLKEAQDDKHKQAAVTRIYKINEQIQNLVNGVLWLAKDVSTGELAKYYCDVELLLYETVSEISENLGLPISNINLRINNPCDICLPIEILKVILRNLISNAAAYSSDKMVSIELSGSTIRIANKGKLPEHDNPTGFGIGLSIVSRLCKKFGIEIDISPDKEQICCNLDLKALKSEDSK